MPIPEWKLERYLLGELSAAESTALATRLENTAREQKRLDSIREQYEEIRQKYPFRKIFPNTRSQSALQNAGMLRYLPSSRSAVAFAAIPLLIGIYFVGFHRRHLQTETTVSGPMSGERFGEAANSQTRGRVIDSLVLGGNDGEKTGNGTGRPAAPVQTTPDNYKTPYSERAGEDSLAVSSKTTRETFYGTGFTPEGEAGSEANIPPGYMDRDYQKAQYNKRAADSKGKKSPDGDRVTRKIIRTGNLYVEVATVRDSVAKIKATLTSLGGHVENENFSKDANDHNYANLTLRIPADRFDNFMSASGAFGKVVNQSANAQDATREYFDTELRLKNDLELKNRLIHVLNTRSGKLSDILEIETELARIAERIELSKGSLRYLDANVAMSQISVQLKEPDAVTDSGRPSTLRQIGAGFARAWYLFLDLLVFVISSLGIVIPVALAGYLGFRLYRKYR